MRRFSSAIIIPILFFLAMNLPVSAQNWQTITSGWHPQRIASSEEGIWAASDGGLFFINPGSREIELRNKDYGFFDNSINVVKVEPETGIIWIGYLNGVIERYDPSSGEIVQGILDFYTNPDVFTISDISFSSDAVFIATDIGVSKLEKLDDNIYIIRETYRDFGAWLQPTKIWRVHVAENYLYAGSDFGLAVVDLETNLIDPSNWALYDIGDEIPLNDDPEGTYVNFIGDAGGDIYFGLYRVQLYRLRNNNFSTIQPNTWTYGITSGDDGSVYIASNRGIGLMNEEGNRWEYLLPDSIRARDLTWAFGSLWTTFVSGKGYQGGIARYTGESLEFFYTNTPGGNQVNEVAVSPSGELWMTAAGEESVKGAYLLRDGTWYPFSSIDLVSQSFIYTLFALGFDDRGGTWVGTRGRGLMNIREENDEFVVEYFNASDTTGARIDHMEEANENFVLVSGFEIEPGKGVWMTNTYADDEKALVFIPLEWYDNPSVEWTRYGRPDYPETNELRNIVRDNSGRLWISSFEPGDVNSLVIFDPNGTPDDPTDDLASKQFQFRTEIGFDVAEDLDLDKDGVLWLATTSGLFYVDTNIESPTSNDFYVMTGYHGEDVTSVTVDPLNHVWVGTAGNIAGLSVLDEDRYTWMNYYTSRDGQYPSQLVDDEITCLDFNDYSGELYIGTNKGLSILSTPYRKVGNELGEIEVRPQPFFVGDDEDVKLTFVNESLVADAKVKIFTPSGRLMRELSFDEVSVDGWDGKRDDGEYVASGVYLIVVTEPGGESKVGKVAVVRK